MPGRVAGAKGSALLDDAKPPGLPLRREPSLGLVEVPDGESPIDWRVLPW